MNKCWFIVFDYNMYFKDFYVLMSLWENDKCYVRVNLILGRRMLNNESVLFFFNSMIYGN